MSGFRETKTSKFNDVIDEEQKMANLISEYQTTLKKKKVNTQVPARNECILKLMTGMTELMKQRKNHYVHMLFTNLSENLDGMETDHNVLNENIQKLERLTEISLKSFQQTVTAHNLRMDNLEEIKSSFEKEIEDLEKNQKDETCKFIENFEEDIKKLQEKLVSETKRSGWENLRQSLFHVMENDS